MVGPLQIEGNSFGLEHVVLLALKSKGQPLDFNWLSQDSIEQARATANTRSGKEHSLNGPLGKLFQHALFGQNTSRGLRMVESENIFLNLISWHVKKNISEP